MTERMSRALLLLYYFPPSGGPGVQRGLKLCRQLPRVSRNQAGPGFLRKLIERRQADPKGTKRLCPICTGAAMRL